MIGHTRQSLAAKAPQPTGEPPECPHHDVDWDYVVEDRGPESVLEGECVQCGCTVQGTQPRPRGEVVDRRRVH